MEEIAIRTMVPDDLPEVAQIEAVCHTTPWTLKSFEYEISNKNAIMKVAVIDGRVIGYVCVRTILDETHLFNVSVLPRFRRRGIGRLLLESVIDDLRDSMPERVLTLEVRESNTAAIMLYRKMGFKESGRRHSYYRKPEEDGIIMEIRP